jgi:hypothetical protein
MKSLARAPSCWDAPHVYYAVYFADPEGMKLEGMIWAPPKPKSKLSSRLPSKSQSKRKVPAKRKRAGRS